MVAFFLISSLFLRGQVDSVFTGQSPSTKPVSHKPPKSEEWKKSLTWGGNFQAWLGNPTFVILSPTIGFMAYKNVNVGLGIIYNYTSYSTSYGSYAQSIFGAHSYVRYIIADSYFLQAQFDKLNQPNLMSFDPNDKIWVNYLMVGGGFRQRLGEKTALTTSIMYNLSPSPLSIYPSRVLVQFGIVGGF
ncbi:MAG: hypothetical protein PSX36_01975 [bacterium]|nr:hypothetical protein [bacterium]